ncbi:MAG: tRNA (adenosine(37)-N6)-dimethylallyltransferase MiaA [Pseudomonadota bacterium]|nr:tRNA (adenosine(37)-N6)-dimethylallyltransferase MiaA [Pseudomonadota bacterium]
MPSETPDEAIPVVLLMGPTASGKTALSFALAERFDVEIVSVDSALVYRGMDIGTAKPDAAVRARIPHHLIDILDPAQAYSAARFAADAGRLIREIRARGRLPLLVGGTMLYFRALTRGLSELPSADPDLRARIEAEAAVQGWPRLHRRLVELDPVTAARLPPNDGHRIQRALEICELGGGPASARFAAGAHSTLQGPVIKLAPNPPERARLHQRIEQRFRQMIDQGLVAEVARLRARGDLDPDMPSMRAVGYRQMWRHLDGETSLEQAVDQGIAATRQFAKRQLTWLRTETDVHYLDPDSPDLARAAEDRIRA